MNKILLFLIIVFSGFGLQTNAQTFSLNLDEAIKLGAENSLQAFRIENTFLSSYWKFRYYKADKLPSLSLTASPFNYNNSAQRVFVESTNRYEYRLIKDINSSAQLQLNQRVGLTGGNLFVNSNLARQMSTDILGKKYTQYSAAPIGIGYSQSLNGYNDQKWRSKIEPLRYEKAKKTFIQSQETMAMRSATMFFDLVEAQIQLKIAQNTMSNADTLYKIGKGRFQVGTVTQDELLNLELNQLNALQTLSRAKMEVERSQSSLNSYLMLDKQARVNCIVPSKIPELQVNADEALTLALKNNPDILDQEQQLLEQDRSVALTKSQSGLSSSEINARYGLNQRAEDIDAVYQDPIKSQYLSISLSVPLVDWGRRKGQLMEAKSNREVVRATVKQARIDFEQNIIQSVMEFNLQAEQVRNAAKADTVAQKGYEVTFQRFLIGKVDVVKLNLARNDLESARKAYINAVKTYWNYYYRLRMLTLFDFVKKETLSAEYDKIIEN
ncbi:MAG: TolC family protein [Methylococcaceae bacterium]|nr:TolC family protein [Prolixibacteraceae bacterium]